MAKGAAALADPKLGNGRKHPGHQALKAVARVVKSTRQAHGQGGGGFALKRQVSQHVAHQRLVNQALAKGLALRRVVERNAQGLAHQRAGAQGAIETGHLPHLQNLRHAAPFHAHQPGGRVQKLDLRAGVALVAQLVFEALHAQLVQAAVGQHAGQKKAAQTAG